MFFKLKEIFKMKGKPLYQIGDLLQVGNKHYTVNAKVEFADHYAYHSETRKENSGFISENEVDSAFRPLIMPVAKKKPTRKPVSKIKKDLEKTFPDRKVEEVGGGVYVAPVSEPSPFKDPDITDNLSNCGK